MEYEVKQVVCDWGVYENGKLLLICGQKKNATLIAQILDADRRECIVVGVTPCGDGE